VFVLPVADNAVTFVAGVVIDIGTKLLANLSGMAMLKTCRLNSIALRLSEDDPEGERPTQELANVGVVVDFDVIGKLVCAMPLTQSLAVPLVDSVGSNTMAI
jgi:hypothetical protein